MKRFLPKSLIGQIALVMAAALLVAQAINFTLIFNERQRATRNQIETPALGRFVAFAQRVTAMPEPARADLIASISRRGRYSLDANSILAPERNDERLAGRLRETAEVNGLVIRDARAAVSDEVPPPRDRGAGPPDDRPGPPGPPDEDRARRFQSILLSIQVPDGRWFNGNIVIPRPDPWLGARLAGSTLLLYFILLVAMIGIAARLARPLRDLTQAADRIQGRGEAPQVEPRGPADLQRAMLAFNAMSARVAAMLDEKDRMLGAIGHDLRTPLASLRIRAESVEPAEERARMVATIEEMTAMLDDTLALARSGRALEAVRIVDLNALADTVVEEFLALGHDVELEETERRTAAVQPNLLRRAVRNLVENAVKYGKVARVAVRDAGETIAIEVADEGPGIPEGEFANVQEAFVRLETSRSRETGGSGLGLALARGAAQAHGGALELANRPEGGLVARILLPKA